MPESNLTGHRLVRVLVASAKMKRLQSLPDETRELNIFFNLNGCAAQRKL
jgi:hypothetical protein